MALGVACAPQPQTLHLQRFTEGSAISRFEPLDRTITDPAVVRQLYDAVSALPPKPPGDYFCPISFGLRHRLTFDAGPKATRVAILEGDGCRVAHLDAFTQRATTESFWAELAGALGLHTRGDDLFPLPRDIAR
jgi:hypothetical protein